MKFKSFIATATVTVIASIVCSFLCDAQTLQTNAQGQVWELVPTNTAPGVLSTNASPQSFITTAFGYLTSFNGDLTNTFSTNQPYQAWIGVSYQSGSFLGGTVGEEAQPFAGARGLTFRAVETLAPQVGTLADAEIDIGWSIVHVDTRITAYVGCDLENRNDVVNYVEKGVVAFGVEIEKALTQNTFAGLYIEDRTSGGLVLGAMTGATF